MSTISYEQGPSEDRAEHAIPLVAAADDLLLDDEKEPQFTLDEQELRSYLARLLGWDQVRAVENAARALELSLKKRTQLVLTGQGDLVPVAYALHRRIVGQTAPFIVCDRRRRDTRASVRSPANLRSGRQAFLAANGGTVCVLRHRLPHDFAELVANLRASDSVRYVCVGSHLPGLKLQPDPWLVSPPPIEIPLLCRRAAEIPQVVIEYMHDATRELRVPGFELDDNDLEWLIAHETKTVAACEKATLRIVAMRVSSGHKQASDRLGMASVSLQRWIARHKPPTHRHERNQRWFMVGRAKPEKATPEEPQPPGEGPDGWREVWGK